MGCKRPGVSGQGLLDMRETRDVRASVVGM